MARRKKLLATMKALDEKYGKEWVDCPKSALQDDIVS